MCSTKSVIMFRNYRYFFGDTPISNGPWFFSFPLPQPDRPHKLIKNSEPVELIILAIF